MKRLTYLALGLNDPEFDFNKSDYYPFVQKLFCPDLFSLRSDIVIMAFNYDVYLEFLLLRAWETRTRQPLESEIRNQATGGFSAPKDTAWLLNDEEKFRAIKLHGSIEWLDNYRSSSFKNSAHERLQSLIEKCTPQRRSDQNYNPPIFFPWEIHGPNEKPPSEDEDEHPVISSMLKQALSTARDDLSKAKKISFVGLSMNPLLDETFTKLFYNTPATRIVVAAPIPQANAHKSEDLAPTHPGHRVDSLLRTARAKSVTRTKVDSFRLVDRSPQPGEMRIVPKFEDFILAEMAPDLG